MKKISLIVPVYNAGNFIEKTINNLLLQTYSEIEFIFVNDGSTDNTLEILNYYQLKDNRIIVVDKKNEGPSSARNIGINKASGDYITFCDADDLLDVSFISDIMNKLGEKDYDFITSAFCNVVYNNNKAIVSKTVVGMKEKELLNSNDVKTFYLQGIINSYTHSPICKLYKLSIINKDKIYFNEDMLFGEDLLFNLDYIEKCVTAYNIEKSYYEYMQVNNPRRLTQRKDIDKFSVYYLWREKLSKYASNIKFDEKEQILKILKNQWFISGINSMYKNDKKDIKCEIKKYIDYNPIVTKDGFKNFVISYIIYSKSIFLILLFSKVTLMIKKKFKPLYYKIMVK